MQQQAAITRVDKRAAATLREALALLKLGRPGEARALLQPLVTAFPRLAEVHRLLAFAQLALGDQDGAARAFAEAAARDRADPSLPACLGELAFQRGRHAEAEEAWRTSLVIDACHVPAAVGLARLLTAQGRAEAALAVLSAPLGRGVQDARLHDAQAAALSSAGRAEEALAARQGIAQAHASQHVAQQNLAAAHLDLGAHGEALAAADRALQLGGDAPELHYLRARALQGLDHFDDAEQAYRVALSRRAAYPEAARDLAQLIWMRSGDLSQALEPLDAAADAAPEQAAPGLHRAQLREFAGEEAAAYDELVALAERLPQAGEVQLAAAKFATRLAPSSSLAHLQRARALGVSAAHADMIEAAARLALGEPERAAALLEPLHRSSPDDQSIIAFLATAWRMAADPRYRLLYDYERLVGCWTIDCPAGWSDLPAYLVQLASELRALHSLTAHPVGQSLRGGTMAERNLRECDSPAVRAFPEAVGGPVRRHLARLGAGSDPVRRRMQDGFAMAGLWTVRLRSGGYHVNHVHPMGWLSSACYIEVPENMGEGQAGWLCLGEPGIATDPCLAAEHHVQPRPGRLVLFPSYMWHGTVPITGDASRLTVAFDIVPCATR